MNFFYMICFLVLNLFFFLNSAKSNDLVHDPNPSGTRSFGTATAIDTSSGSMVIRFDGYIGRFMYENLRYANDIFLNQTPPYLDRVVGKHIYCQDMLPWVPYTIGYQNCEIVVGPDNNLKDLSQQLQLSQIEHGSIELDSVRQFELLAHAWNFDRKEVLLQITGADAFALYERLKQNNTVELVKNHLRHKLYVVQSEHIQCIRELESAFASETELKLETYCRFAISFLDGSSDHGGQNFVYFTTEEGEVHRIPIGGAGFSIWNDASEE